MNKKVIIVLGVIIVLVISILLLKFVSFGTKKSMMGASIVYLEVPKLSTVKSECCSYSATFSSFSSVSIIEKELDSIMSKYFKVSCEGKDYYYDYSQDITITKYEVTSGFPFNTFTIDYIKGNYCDN